MELIEQLKRKKEEAKNIYEAIDVVLDLFKKTEVCLQINTPKNVIIPPVEPATIKNLPIEKKAFDIAKRYKGLGGAIVGRVRSRRLNQLETLVRSRPCINSRDVRGCIPYYFNHSPSILCNDVRILTENYGMKVDKDGQLAVYHFPVDKNKNKYGDATKEDRGVIDNCLAKIFGKES